ncbi:MAG: hypothetical protein JW818_02450, partial [Pirellulales bacterium]|nr:hypothetical protein [Pirellulales bacterium]
PEASQLLSAAREPHGTVKQAVFDASDNLDYTELVDWVHRVVSHTPPPRTIQPASVGLRPIQPPHLSQPFAEPARLPASSEDSEAAKPMPRANPFPFDPLSTAAPSSNLPSNPPPNVRPKVQRGAAPPVFVPADPFDPAIFNRQFWPKGPPGQAVPLEDIPDDPDPPAPPVTTTVTPAIVPRVPLQRP